MRDHNTDIEVYIRPYARVAPYAEHVDLDSLQAGVDGDNLRYLEAKTDKRFEIVINLPASYRMDAEECIQMMVTFDGGPVLTDRIIEQMDRADCGKTTVNIDSTILCFNHTQTSHAMTFGKLLAAPDCTMSDSQSLQEMWTRGKIEVKMFRGELL
ncbi:uncharacterized protein LTR77_010517 [Saxophila tyrrhenica]|uniref:DUF7918 domain-containing protein n=1 Tax=Saxophila tyrrhenica TaxID=1690608 RepID=A0AAV9NYE2_9PEZI|nr:hypothetical protein LTR77_010517 [Saxophila tyrrhenica]